MDIRPRRLYDRPVLWAGIIASAAAAVFEPALHYYLAAHQSAPLLCHHMNNWGNLALAVVVLLGLLSTARILGSRLLALAGLASVSVTAFNVSVNEIALQDPSVQIAPVLLLFGIAYAAASLLFSAAFLRGRPLIDWLSPALGMTWLLAALANLGVSASVVLGSVNLFWWALNAGLGLSVVSHILFCLLYVAVLKRLR